MRLVLPESTKRQNETTNKPGCQAAERYWSYAATFSVTTLAKGTKRGNKNYGGKSWEEGGRGPPVIYEVNRGLGGAPG